MRKGKITKAGGFFIIKVSKRELYSCNYYSASVLEQYPKGTECLFEIDRNNEVIKLIIREAHIPQKGNNKIEDVAVKKIPPKKISVQARLRKELKTTSIYREVNNLPKVKDIFDLSKSKTHSDLRSLKIKEVDNFNLKLNKYAFYEQEYKLNKKTNEWDSKFLFFDKRKKKLIKSNFGNFPFNAFLQKQKKQANLITTTQPECWHQSTNGRMVVGLGGTSVYETSITLHHIYGIPYIPASSIKGVVRSWIIQQIIYPNLLEEDKTFEQLEPKEQNKKLEKAAMQGNVFAAIFGTDDNASDSKAHRGNIIFFDAFPTSEPSIEVDIMTPHYSDYYGDTDNKKQKAPTDTESPIPIPFLTVAKDTKFQFIIGKQKGGADLKLKEEIKNSPLITKSNNKLDENSDLIAITTYWLKQALSQHGIGAKTAVGYGYFNEKEEKCSST